MGKGLWSERKALIAMVEAHSAITDINFVIDPLEVIDYEDFILEHLGLNLFYSIKSVDKLQLFLDRLIHYIETHNKEVTDKGTQYNLFIIVIPQFHIEEFYKSAIELIKPWPINIYYCI